MKHQSLRCTYGGISFDVESGPVLWHITHMMMNYFYEDFKSMASRMSPRFLSIHQNFLSSFPFQFE